MKRFEFKVALHILIIFLLSIGSCLLYQRQLWFSTTVCILFLIGAGMHLYRIQFKQITLLRRLTDGLRYNDMTQNLHPPFKNKMMDEWALFGIERVRAAAFHRIFYQLCQVNMCPQRLHEPAQLGRRERRGRAAADMKF